MLCLIRMKEVVLRVAEGLSQDVGAGRARLDAKTRIELDISPGDVIEIEGGRKTGAIVWRARPSDEGLGIIRIDNLTRKNARVGIGDKVIVRKAEDVTADNEMPIQNKDIDINTKNNHSDIIISNISLSYNVNKDYPNAKRISQQGRYYNLKNGNNVIVGTFLEEDRDKYLQIV